MRFAAVNQEPGLDIEALAPLVKKLPTTCWRVCPRVYNWTI